MRREGLGGMLEKPKEVIVARFRLFDTEEVALTEEFESEEEKDQWYEAFGKWLELEEGGVIEFETRPADKKSGGDLNQ